MNLETPRQRIIVLGLLLGLAAVVVLASAAVVVSLSEANVGYLGAWIDRRGGTIWTAGTGVAAAVATFLFGRRSGRKSGKTEAYNSAIATARSKTTGDEAADVLRAEARSHGLNVAT
jgi:hypothetical protein